MFKNEMQSELLKLAVSEIDFENLNRYLPFQTRIVAGDNFNHIQSQTAFDIKTGKFGKYTVSEGDTLCRRADPCTFIYSRQNDDCPGCLAIAHDIIKRDIKDSGRG